MVPGLRAERRHQRLVRHEVGPFDGFAGTAIVTYTPKEGEYLAFIYYYTKLNRQAPAERDMQVYFRVTPPAVHDMVVKLEKHGFISKEPGVPRSIRLLLTREELPDLE